MKQEPAAFQKKEIIRSLELQRLSSLKDIGIIKVLCGLRGSGMHTVVSQYISRLHQLQTPEDHIIRLNLRNALYTPLCSEQGLFSFLNERVGREGNYYIFLEEIQYVKNFQQTIDRFSVMDNTDMILTTSSRRIFQEELSHLLLSQYTEINILPLSLDECRQLMPQRERDALFPETGLPLPASLLLPLADRQNSPEYDKARTLAREYLRGILENALVRDICPRYGISDTQGLLSLMCLVCLHRGQYLTPKSLSSLMEEELGMGMNSRTVESYLQALTDSYLICRLPRWDISTDQPLKTREKIYPADRAFSSILFAVPPADGEEGSLAELENALCLDLLRHGYHAWTGRYRGHELSLIGISGTERIYLQCIAQGPSYPQKLKKAENILRSIPDNYRKYIVTDKDQEPENHAGILIRTVTDLHI